MSEEEKTIIDFLKKCKENKDKLIPLLQQSNEVLLNYIDKLNNELQQKENIIKEVREKIKLTESKEKFCIKYIQIDRKRYDSIIKLLDKGLDKGE